MPPASPSSPNAPPSPSQRSSRIPKRKPSLSIPAQPGSTSQPGSPRMPTAAGRMGYEEKKREGGTRGVSMPVARSREVTAMETRERDRPAESHSAPRRELLQSYHPSPSSSAAHPHHPSLSAPRAPSTLAHPPQIRFPSAQSHSSSSAYSIPSSSPSNHLTPSPAAPIHCSSSPSSSLSTSSARRCSMPPRPKMERPSSTTYTSFPLPPPRTPGDFATEERRIPFWGWFTPSSASSAQAQAQREGGDLESGAGEAAGNDRSGKHTQHSSLGERARLLGLEEEIRPHPLDRAGGGPGPGARARQEGLPKVTRGCLVAEVRCYGKYILPPLFLFVFLALSISLYAYGRALEHEEGSGGGAAEP